MAVDFPAAVELTDFPVGAERGPETGGEENQELRMKAVSDLGPNRGAAECWCSPRSYLICPEVVEEVVPVIQGTTDYDLCCCSVTARASEKDLALVLVLAVKDHGWRGYCRGYLDLRESSGMVGPQAV
jgi:hypothetical protein